MGVGDGLEGYKFRKMAEGDVDNFRNLFMKKLLLERGLYVTYVTYVTYEPMNVAKTT